MQKSKTIFIHLGLFIITFAATTVSGIEWSNGFQLLATAPEKFWSWESVKLGLMYSCSFLGILTIHEFGHYFFAKYYKANVTLPYYIPLYIPIALSIGTLGAVIRIKSPFKTRFQSFDVGVAGPLAGFVAALCILIYGFTHLPEPEYIYNIHPEYEEVFNEHGMWNDTVYSTEVMQSMALKQDPDMDSSKLPTKENVLSLGIGSNLLMTIMANTLVEDAQKLPPKFELMHYPFLFAGFLACFFTAINLLPFGQLDGGHVLYGLLGPKRFNQLSPWLYKGFIFYAGLGIISPHLFNSENLNEEWYYKALYVIMLFVIFSRIYPDIKKRLYYIFIILSLQFITVFIFPDAHGYPTYLFFAFIVSLLGIRHPYALEERKMSKGRMVVGVIALIVFILCFSPAPFQM